MAGNAGKPRAALYARYSTDLQNRASIEDQLRDARAFAKRAGYSVVAEFSDAAESGASMMRHGIQRLLSEAAMGKIDVIVTEALDRLSRNMADIARIFQRLTFDGVHIETLTEGRIDELHVGLKGTMNAMYLSDLRTKTRRGLKGRVEAGKSAGGRSYGYEVVQQRDARGEPIRGDRRIDPTEAAVVRRIMSDYAAGISPQKIAQALNREGIPAPRGGGWSSSTINGNKQRGNGILNNRLYIGELVWNRQEFRKDPDRGKRGARANAEEEWVVTPVPELRIVDDALWEAVKRRQEATAITVEHGSWDRRRPRFLLSGLMVCGECGGGFSKVSQTRFGCSQARNKGETVCTNRLTIGQRDIEGRILHALEAELMDPDLVAAFCAEYTAERNRLRAEAEGNRAGLEAELRKLEKTRQNIARAIMDGMPAEGFKEEMTRVMARKAQLEAELSHAPAPDPVRLHPGMAETYRARIGTLIRALGDAEAALEAREAVRALIDRVILTPEGGRLVVDLQGDLAEILQLALGKRPGAKTQGIDIVEELVMVAGVGFEPTTFRL